MLLYFAIQQHRFELRWRWVVSSLLQQRTPRRFGFMVDCALLSGERSPYLFPEALASFLTYHETPRDVFARRGFVRDLQVARAREAGADWIYFGDADHMYPPEYLESIAKLCRSHRRRNESRVLFDWSKLTTDRAETDSAVKSMGFRRPSDWVVSDAYDRACSLPMMTKPPNVHAGGAMQLARMDAIMEKTRGRYIHPRYHGKTWDWDMFTGQRARSDWQFRAAMGERRICLDSRPVLHLNHHRDKEVGRHWEKQR